MVGNVRNKGADIPKKVDLVIIYFLLVQKIVFSFYSSDPPKFCRNRKICNLYAET
jgi:hypothetical protein